MIHVIATIELKPGMRERVLKEFEQLAPQVRHEKGCIEYGGAVDIASGIAVQIPLRDDVLTVVEKWSDVDALKAHLAAPHMATYRAKVKDWVVKSSIQVLEPKG